MIGTGTQTDPYIPENWDEFVTAIGTSKAYVELPEGGGVFDMNELDPIGGHDILLQCESIAGNGWTIKNSYNIRWNAGFGLTKMTDLNFLNFYYNNAGNSGYSFILYSCEMTNCKFSGIIGGRSMGISGHKSVQCTFNFKFIENAWQAFGTDSLNFCKIAIDHSDNIKTGSDNSYLRYYNCFIEHKANAAGGQIYFAGNSSILHSDAGNYILTASGTKVSVTEEQLQSTEYLRSIGFPIVGDSA